MSAIILTILWALLYVAIGVGLVYLIIWLLGLIGVPVTERVKQIAIVIVVILVLIWVISSGATGSAPGFGIRHS